MQVILTLLDHIRHFETRIHWLKDALADPHRAESDIERFEEEIRTAELSLEVYQKALQREQQAEAIRDKT